MSDGCKYPYGVSLFADGGRVESVEFELDEPIPLRPGDRKGWQADVVAAGVAAGAVATGRERSVKWAWAMNPRCPEPAISLQSAPEDADDATAASLLGDGNPMDPPDDRTDDED